MDSRQTEWDRQSSIDRDYSMSLSAINLVIFISAAAVSHGRSPRRSEVGRFGSRACYTSHHLSPPRAMVTLMRELSSVSIIIDQCAIDFLQKTNWLFRLEFKKTSFVDFLRVVFSAYVLFAADDEIMRW